MRFAIVFDSTEIFLEQVLISPKEDDGGCVDYADECVRVQH